MPRKAFQFVEFEPALWDMPNQVDTTVPVLDVEGSAPQGAPRPTLRSRVFPRADTPNDAFQAFNGRHDTVGRIIEYERSDEDTTTERIFVRPSEFQAYELRRSPGWLYVTASDSTLKQMFRRYRESTGEFGTTFNRRIVRIGDLEQRLNEMEIVGYTLGNVRSTTPISNYDVLGQQMDQNTEVQDARNRAERIRAITFDLLRGDTILRVRVAENGSVTFFDYPGDATALGVIDRLETYIQGSADVESIEIRQGRSS